MRSSFFATTQQCHELYVDLLMQMQKKEESANLAAEALQAHERARARSLLELLAESGSGLRKGVEPELLARERELSRAIIRTQTVGRGSWPTSTPRRRFRNWTGKSMPSMWSRRATGSDQNPEPGVCILNPASTLTLSKYSSRCWMAKPSCWSTPSGSDTATFGWSAPRDEELRVAGPPDPRGGRRARQELLVAAKRRWRARARSSDTRG